ncbi:hypothetical protein DUI87_15012 [Hirundo rustica rustica]|uniref:Uncharacterized protein n=1 Tax=Hirundo rustica rustica TaxID=333673 RepID=A0A3M0K6F8_HIRRU|nr:hypothetical protein DUI87_15012 [Hirundo rustica rustica]
MDCGVTEDLPIFGFPANIWKAKLLSSSYRLENEASDLCKGGCLIPGSVQGQVGQGLEHPETVEDVPDYGTGWNKSGFKVLSNPNHPGILELFVTNSVETGKEINPVQGFEEFMGSPMKGARLFHMHKIHAHSSRLYLGTSTYRMSFQ